MSIVNRSPQDVKSFTSNTQTSLENIIRSLCFLDDQIKTISSEINDPNLNAIQKTLNDIINAYKTNLKKSINTNNRLTKESNDLISASQQIDYVKIDTEQAATELKNAYLAVYNFHNCLCNYCTKLSNDLKNKVIGEKLNELKTKAESAINTLLQKKSELSNYDTSDQETGQSPVSEEMKMLDEKIEYLKKIIIETDKYSDDLYAECDNLERPPSSSQSICGFMNRFYSNTSDTVTAIENAVKNQ